MRRGLFAAIAAMAAVPLLAAQPAAPALDEILARAAKYVASYQQGLRGIVAEETYFQNYTWRGRASRGRVVREGRQLKSDLLLVKLPTQDRWLQFRDVFEVDRRPVRDRDQRLYQLFVDAKPDAQQQAEAIQKESARYNIGPVLRTINIPMLGMYFFDRTFAVGVKYTLGRAGNVKRFAALAPAESISLVEFRETTDDTAIKGENGRSLPAHGKAWIDHTNGRVLMTELVTEDNTLNAQIFVTYRNEPGLPVLVPEEMREVYLMIGSDTRIDGRAKYARFRQFTVTTTEKTKP